MTVLLLSAPRLTRSQERKVRAEAAILRHNVLQDPPLSAYPKGLSPRITIREKPVSSDCCCGVTNVPSWTDPHNPATAHNNYRDLPSQSSPAFLAKYASNPHNMGPYWVGGVKEPFGEFMHR